MKHAGLTVCVALLVIGTASAQNERFGFIDPMPTARLRLLFPRAVAFSERAAEPLHFRAYATDPQGRRDVPPLGYAFWTTDLMPEERGYHGHIHMMIGMDTHGVLTGVIVDANTEPYGSWSIEP